MKKIYETLFISICEYQRDVICTSGDNMIEDTWDDRNSF